MRVIVSAIVSVTAWRPALDCRKLEEPGSDVSGRDFEQVWIGGHISQYIASVRRRPELAQGARSSQTQRHLNTWLPKLPFGRLVCPATSHSSSLQTRWENAKLLRCKQTLSRPDSRAQGILMRLSTTTISARFATCSSIGHVSRNALIRFASSAWLCGLMCL